MAELRLELALPHARLDLLGPPWHGDALSRRPPAVSTV